MDGIILKPNTEFSLEANFSDEILELSEAWHLLAL
jgi:hypothetical protein